MALPDEIHSLAEAQQQQQRTEGEPLDLAVLDGYRRPAPRFPVDLMGSKWSGWARDAAEGAGAPVDYVACSLLAAAAGAVGNARRVSPWEGWSEPLVLWMCLVGEPSTSKSPAVDPVLKAISNLEERQSRDFQDEYVAWEERAAVAKIVRKKWQSDVKEALTKGKEPPFLPDDAQTQEEPDRPRIRVSDATPEALAKVLASNPRGVLLWRDEVAGWLGGFGRYTSTSAGERALWLEAFGGRSYIIDRVKSGSLLIPHLSVSILGTAQPTRLQSLLLSSDDDGLAARFLWVWPEPRSPVRPDTSANVGMLESAFDRLRSLPMTDHEPTTLTLENEAVGVFQEWRSEQFRSVRGAAGMLASAYGKAAGLVLRLALTLELLDAAGGKSPDPTSVSTTSITSAITLWTDYFAPMTERTFGDAALPDKDRDASTLARWIVSARPEIINTRELYHHVRLPGLTEPKRTRAAIEGLIEAGWLVAAPSRQGGGAGRRREDYRVQDGVYDLLDAQMVRT